MFDFCKVIFGQEEKKKKKPGRHVKAEHLSTLTTKFQYYATQRRREQGDI